ncbi:MAG: hypothetical protein NT107_00460 [Planctomycetota bacterium]|nr:hypothetical protein [Planctomycetota bacterium]MSR40022.1 hypothetical protein [Planctomycetota bacterium]
MRTQPLAPPAILLALFSACSATQKTAEQRIIVSPYFAGYRLGGKLGMADSQPSGTPTNGQQPMRELGQDRYEEDYGFRADFGNGAAGLRAEWLKLSMHPTDTGVLSDDFGAIPAGSTVNSDVTLEEFRIGYLHEVWTGSGGPENFLLDLQLAAGGLLSHVSTEIDVRETTGSAQQNVSLKDRGILYPALHLRASHQAVAMDLEYALSPNLTFGGDYDGWLQDIEARITYTVPFQDVGLFAGYRFATLPVDSSENGLAVNGDLRIDGIQLGIIISF